MIWFKKKLSKKEFVILFESWLIIYDFSLQFTIKLRGFLLRDFS